ncbi:MAG: glutamyl-tRNA amidotransferase, partial [Gemmatimonadetes bacterium]|nr:glutamyl-tRNA amidotransferase [Gemmatimonadota bacterium]
MPLSPLAQRLARSLGTRFLALVTVVLWSASVPILALPAPASAQTLELSSATIADLNRAFDAGTLTSERLVQLYLARIEAYDKVGPALNAIIQLNPKALETARALDAERRQRGPRSPLHGIAVVLKDNIDTEDMPTTGGSLVLKGSVPPDDAFIVKKLRDAGAIIFAKVNLSEFAAPPQMSSLIGSMRNPHDLARNPGGSSGGTGVAIAAWFAQLGIGTDTGGSVRSPTTANGIAGLKPTRGLLSRDGIIPLSLTLDTGGPMARHVYDVATMLGVMTGVDPADAATRASEGRFETDYTRHLDAGALRGARIGIARDFMGVDQEVDWIVESALETMRKAGATVLDVRYPEWLLAARGGWFGLILRQEFSPQLGDYLTTLGPQYPKTLAELVERASRITSAPPDGGVPNPARWTSLRRSVAGGNLSDPEYLAVMEHALPLLRAAIEGILRAQNLDAIIYPTAPTRPGLVSGGGAPAGGVSATNIANLTGFPDLIVPAGFTGDRLPVGLSFFGPAFSEAKLLALGYAFEQATHA